jgi:hypothetical protein
MLPDNNKVVSVIPPTITLTVGSAGGTGYLDTRGFDHLQLILSEIIQTETVQIATLIIGENDTVPANAAGLTPIPALSCAAAVTTTALNVLPSPNSVVSNLYRWNIDLKGRKRYIGINYIPGVTASVDHVSCIGILSRCQSGPAEAVSTSLTGTTILSALRLDACV